MSKAQRGGTQNSSQCQGDGDRQTSGAQWPTSLSELINSRLLRDPDSKIQNGKMTEEDARHPTLTFDIYPLNALGHTHNHSHSHTQTHTHTVHSYLDTNTYIQSLVMLSSYPNLPRSSQLNPHPSMCFLLRTQSTISSNAQLMSFL